MWSIYGAKEGTSEEYIGFLLNVELGVLLLYTPAPNFNPTKMSRAGCLTQVF